MNIDDIEKQLVRICYLNHRGEADMRTILPARIFFGNTPWHHDQQWMLQAHDIDKGLDRTFALKDIHWWRPLS